ncbi:MAG TPA: UDP-2,3-diacylglucosamine diphosphatase [Steroidobacteraceae bacterium]|nr:UDP-2,3-diacylglucosamine diphosphatase [Steroidobacteraceae bacterium]
MSSKGKEHRHQVRTLFLSDVHLGFKRARTRELLAFLRGVEAQTIVLGGDIVDALSLARRFFWTDEHTQVLRALLARRRAGVRLVYLPGNHDASVSVFVEMLQGQIEVHREWVYRTSRGERYLVLHGDQFDEEVDCPAWLYWIGDRLYEGTLLYNHRVNDARRLLGLPYRPQTEKLKMSVAASARFIRRFESVAAAQARHQGYDGVICGHIHRANLCRIEGTFYANTGDWVESCSALVETRAGEMQLLRWPHGAVGSVSLATLLADAA